MIAKKFYLRKKSDFIFAIGDDWTDEYLFKELPDSAVTVKVGLKNSSANYYVNNTENVRELLQGFLEA